MIWRRGGINGFLFVLILLERIVEKIENMASRLELRVGRVNTAFNVIVSAHCAQQAYPFAPLPEQV